MGRGYLRPRKDVTQYFRSWYCPPNLYKALKKKAAAEERSVSYIMRAILTPAVAEYLEGEEETVG